jgi:TonB family protein
MDGPMLAQRLRRVMDPDTQEYVKRLGKAPRVVLLASAGLLLWVAMAVDVHGVARAQFVPFAIGTREKPDQYCLCFITDAMPAVDPVTPAQAAEMERQLAANPEDESTRVKLLHYDWNNNLETQRTALVLWLIDHHPESALHKYETAGVFLIGSNGNPAVYEDARNRWLAQVSLHADDARILGNAARVFRQRGFAEAIDPLQRAQKLDPAHWTKTLAWVDSKVLVRSTAKTATPLEDPGLVARIRSELLASNDIGLVGEAADLVVDTAHRTENHSYWDFAALKTIATELVGHAQALEPEEQKWADLLEDVKSLPDTALPSPETPQLVRVSSQVAAGNLIKAPLPVYPPLAKKARIQGTVILYVRVDANGHVNFVRFLSGHPMLVRAALHPVWSYVYSPFLLNGSAVPFETTVTVVFSLGGNQENPDNPVKTSGENAEASVNLHDGPPPFVTVSNGVAATFLVESPKTIFPPLAKQARIQGTVMLKVLIGKDGHVLDVKVISGHPMLVPAAIDAVKQYVYKPYFLNSNPVEVQTVVDVPFEGDQS